MSLLGRGTFAFAWTKPALTNERTVETMEPLSLLAVNRLLLLLLLMIRCSKSRSRSLSLFPSNRLFFTTATDKEGVLKGKVDC